MDSQANIIAIQANNRRYAKQSGAISKNQVIQIIWILAHVVAFLSIWFSAYGLYYDLVLDYGHNLALSIAILGGLFIEAVKYAMVKAYFAWHDDPTIQGISFIILAIFTSAAIALHYKGLENMMRTKVIEVINEIQEKNIMLLSQEQDRKDKIVDIAGAMVKNGTIHDDKIAMETLSGINTYQNSLLSRGELSNFDTMRINEVREASKKRAESLKVVFPLFEVLSIFGFLGMFLSSRSASNGVKRVIREQEAIDTVEALSPTEKTDDEKMADQIIGQMRAKKLLNSNPQTFKENTPNTTSETSDNTQEISVLDEKEKPEEHVDTTTEEPRENNKEHFYDAKECFSNEGDEVIITPENEKVRAIDMNLFHDEKMKQMISVLWKKGTVKANGKLETRDFILKEMGTGGGNAGILTSLYEELLKLEYVEKRPVSGYFAKVELAQAKFVEKG